VGPEDLKTLRALHFVVQPILVWDDGADLTPGPVVEPQALTLAGVRDLVDNWPEKLAELERASEQIQSGEDGPPA
jgi:hypothetical protein